MISSPEAFPERQDCGIGWLGRYRQEAPGQVVSGLSVSTRDANNQIVRHGDYGTLDALVQDGWGSAIAPHYQTDLVAVCSFNTLYRKHRPLINAMSPDRPNMEILANREVMKNPQLGGLPAMTVPFFPDDAVLVTSLTNLSLYWLEGSVRTLAKDEPEYNRLAVYESWNEAYMVEEYEAGCLIDGIVWKK